MYALCPRPRHRERLPAKGAALTADMVRRAAARMARNDDGVPVYGLAGAALQVLRARDDGRWTFALAGCVCPTRAILAHERHERPRERLSYHRFLVWLDGACMMWVYAVGG